MPSKSPSRRLTAPRDAGAHPLADPDTRATECRLARRYRCQCSFMQAQHIEFLQLFNGPVQYVVPRWQRRYRWGQFDIERLVEDLLTVASAGSDAAHYGGTLLTFPEPGVPSGVVKPIRVVDGQQRLTTVSILLACIANRLGSEGRCGEWTAEIIQDDRLTNPGKEKFRKLRLQDGDDEEYPPRPRRKPDGLWRSDAGLEDPAPLGRRA